MVDILIAVELIFMLAIGPAIVGVFLWRRAKRNKEETYKIGIIDEARSLKWHEVLKSKIKDIGRFAVFEIDKKDYFIQKAALITNGRKPTLIYKYNDPVPFTFSRSSSTTTGNFGHTEEAIQKNISETGAEINAMSASEVREAQDSKVVFDLLRFTLSKVETLFVLVVMVNLIMTGIAIYFGYQASNGISTANDTLKVILRALFPGTVTTP